MYAFWAIAQGILIGAQEYFLAIMLNLIMIVVLIVMFKLNNKNAKRMILIVKHNEQIDLSQFEELLKQNFKKFLLKEQKVSKAGEIIVEVICFNNKINTDLNSLKIDGIEEISLIDYVEPMI